MSSDPQIEAVTPCLMVRDVVSAHAYYADKLGFSSPRMWGDPPTFCICSREGFNVMLAQVDPGMAVHPNAENEWRIDAYFRVRDVDALHAEFAAKGAHIVCEPDDQEYGMREIYVRDTDGHALCFGQPIAGSA